MCKRILLWRITGPIPVLEREEKIELLGDFLGFPDATHSMLIRCGIRFYWKIVFDSRIFGWKNIFSDAAGVILSLECTHSWRAIRWRLESLSWIRKERDDVQTHPNEHTYHRMRVDRSLVSHGF